MYYLLRLKVKSRANQDNEYHICCDTHYPECSETNIEILRNQWQK